MFLLKYCIITDISQNAVAAKSIKDHMVNRCNRHFFLRQNFPPGEKCLGFYFPRGKDCLILGTFSPGGKNQGGGRKCLWGCPYLSGFFPRGKNLPCKSLYSAGGKKWLASTYRQMPVVSPSRFFPRGKNSAEEISFEPCKSWQSPVRVRGRVRLFFLGGNIS